MSSFLYCRVVPEFYIFVFVEVTTHDTFKNIMQKVFVYVACSYMVADVFGFPEKCLRNRQISINQQKLH